MNKSLKQKYMNTAAIFIKFDKELSDKQVEDINLFNWLTNNDGNRIVYLKAAKGFKQISEALPFKQYTLKELQDLVGGYIEYVYGDKLIAIVDESGLIKNLEQNLIATDLLGINLVGNALVMSRVTFEKAIEYKREEFA